jgi:hypothetical protein
VYAEYNIECTTGFHLAERLQLRANGFSALFAVDGRRDRHVRHERAGDDELRAQNPYFDGGGMRRSPRASRCVLESTSVR